MTQDVLFENGKLVISNSDVVWTDSDKQHIIDTINANLGSWKENPFDGVGIKNYLNGTNIGQKLSKKIRQELTKDQYTSTPVIRQNTDGTTVIYPNVIVL